jgi:hypothetical protein
MLKSRPAERAVERLLDDLRLRFAECESIHAHLVNEAGGIVALVGDFTLLRDGNKRVYRYPLRLPERPSADALEAAIEDAFDRLSIDITRLARPPRP